MNKFITVLFLFTSFFSLTLSAQEIQGISSVERLTGLAVSKNTGEKPQSKVWSYACTQWTVLPDTSGTHLWRLDDNSWTRVMTLSTSTVTKADCKVKDAVVHVLLFEEVTPITNIVSEAEDSTKSLNNKAFLVSIEYEESQNTYKRWSQRPTTLDIKLDNGVETASIDIDSKGRMWLASDAVNKINVRWSDAPYTSWSSPITLATGVKNDDIAGVVALPGKVGVFWSNQNARRFGFKTHQDGASPSQWSADEMPASHSALNVGKGMADDHVNFAIASDGTLYCAVKTSYDMPGYPTIALLVRRPWGKWDKMYGISEFGTRPVALLDETLNRLMVIYSSVEGGGDILYKSTSLASINFGPQLRLMDGKFDNVSSSKAAFKSEAAILVSNKTHAHGVLISNGSPSLVKCPDFVPSFRSFVVYPNPFIAKTTVYFTLQEDDDYELLLFDSKGARIATLSKGRAQSGELNTVDLKDVARGLYVVRLQTSKSVRALKVIQER
ncbi:T9SS type A sorting domain-containing protein [Pontibacter lucknowensis]|uniref:Por secretion system C-terminal sorting domain-containing protein n=1 Tax=Pontibacter lucknowensis TaxID=1077936 RepID=A0A1N7AZG6_9BACT|nr:T9SS type A sorting domain-containing protein [Pontibacter lucknowensis]SIR44485.1 Por secretion system C-terminal sorting domain-containing protein [Pontibacter lucknowensis]